MKVILFFSLFILICSCGSDYTDQESFNFSEFANDNDAIEEIKTLAFEKGLVDGTFYVQYLGFTSPNCEIQTPLFYVYTKWEGTGKAMQDNLSVGQVTGNVYNNPTMVEVRTVDFFNRLFYYYDGKLTHFGAPYGEDYHTITDEIKKYENDFVSFFNKKIPEVYTIATKKTGKGKFESYYERASYVEMEHEIRELNELKTIFKNSKNKVIEVKLKDWKKALESEDASDADIASVKTKNLICLFDKWIERRGYKPINRNSSSYLRAKKIHEAKLAEKMNKLEFIRSAEDVAKLYELYRGKYNQIPNKYDMLDSLKNFTDDDSTFMRYYNSLNQTGWSILRHFDLNEQCFPVILANGNENAYYGGFKDRYLSTSKNVFTLSIDFYYWRFFNFDLPETFKVTDENENDLKLGFVSNLNSWVIYHDDKYILTDCNKTNLVTFEKLPKNLPSGEKFKKIIDPDKFGWAKATLKTSEELINEAER